jgi:signal transduction histidine kinase
MKIRVKMLIIIVLVVLVTGIAVTLIGRSIATGIVKDQVGDRLLTTAHSRADHIETILQTRMGYTDLFAEEVGLILQGSINTVEEDIPSFSYVANGVISATEDIDRALFLDESGTVVISTDPISYPLGSNLSSSEAFVAGQQDAYLGAWDLVGSEGQFMLCTAAPLAMDKDATRIGALVFLGGEDTLFEIATEGTGLGETGEVYLVNQESYMITPSRFVEDAILSQRVDLPEYVTEPETAGTADEGAALSDAVSSTNYVGSQVLAVYHSMDTVDWTLVAEMGKSEAFAPVSRLTTTTLWVLLGIVVLGIMAALILSRTISRPIERLHRGTEAIMQGNWEYDVSTSAQDEIGELSRAFSTMTSSLRQAHSELKQYNVTLEERVTERTAEAEKLLKQKDELMRRMGHDLKSPLVPILSLLPMVRERETDRHQAEMIDIAIERANYMQQLVTQVLKLARRGATAQPPEFVDVDLSGAIRNVIRGKETATQQRDIKIANRADHESIVRGEALGIHELLDNLIGNAIKYTPKGGTITVSTDTNGDLATVSVNDTGIGMTDEHLTHIFDEFYRVDESQEELESSGLGLAICKRIVEQHGGSIWAESPGLGQGTTVYFTLRLAEMSAEADETAAEIAQG